ncbi:MAG: hypothetical protein IMF10_05685 [Proteobacteria bacterium]|nr:hypothetical protein [Pseudomonadota bacterium]
MKTCHHCKKELDIDRKVGRRDTCPFCDADLHVCLNCRFRDPGAYNQCRETQAERVIDKERSNFCDYFDFRDAAPGESREEKRQRAKEKLETLFKTAK